VALDIGAAMAIGIGSSMSAMKDDIDRLRSDLVNLSVSLRDVASDPVRARLVAINGQIDRIADADCDYVGEPPTYIGVRPFLGAVLAFGAGLLIGRLLDR
jgi:hypothetical protein